MNRRFVLELVDFLRKYQLVDTIDDDKIQAAIARPVLGNIMELLLPQQMLVYDLERVQGDDDFTALVQDYVALTNGAWTPANIQSTFNWDEERASIEFDFRQEHFRWELEQQGDYVGSDFLTAIGEFCDTHLQATLINLHFLSQELYVLYLPKSIAAEFLLLVSDFTPSSDEIADFVKTVDDWKGLTGWLLVKEVLSQHNLSKINQPTRDDDLVLRIVLDMVKRGSHDADELIHFLVDFGAEPKRLDEESIQYWRRKWKTF